MLRRFCLIVLGSMAALNPLEGQRSRKRVRVEEIASRAAVTAPTREESGGRARSPSERAESDRARQLAHRAREFRVVISLDDRLLHVLHDKDTLQTSVVAVASNVTLRHGGRTWIFRTPLGKRTVIDSKVNPVWIPPDWLYAEAASENNLKLAWLPRSQPIKLQDGRLLTVQDSAVGVVDHDGMFQSLPDDEHIVFDSTLFVPPFGTVNRRVPGALGEYALNLGSGYLLHGTPYLESLGRAATHGCIRLGDEEIRWLYHNVPKGTPVYIY